MSGRESCVHLLELLHVHMTSSLLTTQERTARAARHNDKEEESGVGSYHLLPRKGAVAGRDLLLQLPHPAKQQHVSPRVQHKRKRGRGKEVQGLTRHASVRQQSWLSARHRPRCP